MSEPQGEPVTVVPLGDGRYLVMQGPRRRLAFGARSGGTTWVFLDGAVLVVDATRGRARSGDHQTALTAPMPATVLRVDVAPGQRVTRGDLLIVLEAMKMELPLTAPRDGVIKAVRGRPGELVQPGVPLVELE